MAWYAIGSSYLIRQAPGAESFGGVTVKIRPRRTAVGTVEVCATHWRAGEAIQSDVTFLTDAAVEGVTRYAADNAIDLNDWDITVSRFAYHDVDSRRQTTRIAAYNAIASAFAAWNSALLQPREQ